MSLNWRNTPRRQAPMRMRPESIDCARCGERFASMANLQDHQVAGHCLSVTDMVKRGFVKNQDALWQLQVPELQTQLTDDEEE